jgi:hypothetical protein
LFFQRHYSLSLFSDEHDEFDDDNVKVIDKIFIFGGGKYGAYELQPSHQGILLSWRQNCPLYGTMLLLPQCTPCYPIKLILDFKQKYPCLKQTVSPQR